MHIVLYPYEEIENEGVGEYENQPRQWYELATSISSKAVILSFNVGMAIGGIQKEKKRHAPVSDQQSGAQFNV